MHVAVFLAASLTTGNRAFTVGPKICREHYVGAYGKQQMYRRAATKLTAKGELTAKRIESSRHRNTLMAKGKRNSRQRNTYGKLESKCRRRPTLTGTKRVDVGTSPARTKFLISFSLPAATVSFPAATVPKSVSISPFPPPPSPDPAATVAKSGRQLALSSNPDAVRLS